MRSSIAAAAALSLGSAVQAQSIAKTCPTTGVCFSLNIPETTASSGDGPIYFQISAPTTMQWVAIGQGSQMAGSNIFVMYTSADGKNTTLSPRLGTGHVEPQHDTAAKVTLLTGSGVSNGVMTANVECTNCQSWSGGTMDFTGSSGNWIYAYKSGSSLDSDDLAEDISQHDANDNFEWQFAQAKGGSDVNPFVNAAASSGSASGSSTSLPACTATTSAAGTSQTLAQPSGSGCPTSWPSEYSSAWPTARPTWASSCFASGHGSWPTNAPWARDLSKRQEQACDDGSGSTSGSSSDTGSGGDTGSATFSNADSPFGGDDDMGDRIIKAHAILAALAFVALFPIGGILIRVANFTGVVWVHAAAQALAYAIYIAAFGLGVYYASQTQQLTQAHPIIGIVLFIILFFQPLSGWMHHKMFGKTGGRSAWSYEHLGIGRIAILLGLINGGLGIQLAGDVSRGGTIAYAVCAAVMGLLYIAAIIYGEIKRKRALPPSYESSQGKLQTLNSREESASGVHEHYAKPE